MKVEIWSDVMCPFCYIGKRHFEQALEQFPGRNDIEISWKSFQLNPALKTEPGKSVNEHLAEVKGWTMEQAQQANEYVTNMARQAGLTYHMDKAVVANSFDAHRLLQFAKVYGKGDEIEEQLFKAYFTDGKNIADHAVLIQLAKAAGLDEELVKNMLAGKEYADLVEADIYEAQQIGVRGVPYFVFNDRYAVSGAQPVETFAGALQQSWGEWTKEKPVLKDLSSGDAVACTPGGDCN